VRSPDRTAASPPNGSTGAALDPGPAEPLAPESASAVADDGRLLREQPLLSGLPDAVRELVLDSFVPAHFASGEEIVRQGDPSDGFYVVSSGRAQTTRLENGNAIAIATLARGDTFGESDLLEQTPHRATVRALGAVKVLRLEPALFAAIVRRHPEVSAGLAVQRRARRLEPLLRSHPVFAPLSHEELMGLVVRLEEVSFAAGCTIFNEGDPAGPLYLVADGRLRVSDSAHGTLRYLRGGDIFGEVSLFLGSSRTASVEAISSVRLLALEAEVFRGYLEQNAEMRKRVGEQLAFYERGPARHVPLDFADYLLPGAEPEEAAGTIATGTTGAPVTGPEAPVLTERRRRAAPSIRRLRARRVRFIPQLEETDGPATCLAMVCRRFGHEVRVSHVRDVLGAIPAGASAADMQRGGEALGLDVRPLTLDVTGLAEIRLPALVHWPGEHWSVLDEVRPDRLHVADPASDAHWISHHELEHHWDGTVLAVSPTEALAAAPTEHPDLGWLVPLVRPHARLMLLVFGLALIAAVLQMLVPVVTGEIIDNVVKQKDYTRLYILTAGLFGLQAVALGAALLEAAIATRVAVAIDGDSLDHVAGRLLRLPLRYFETRRSGEIEHRLGALRTIREFAAQQGVQSLAQVSQLIAALIVMAFLSVPLTLAWLASAPVYLWFIRVAVRRVRPAIQAEEEGFSRLRSRQLDAIGGVEAVKSMGMEEALRRRMLNDFDEVANRVARADLVTIRYGGAVAFATFLLVVLFLFFGALEVMAGNLTIGELVAFNSLILLSSGPIIWLLDMWQQAQAMTVLLGRLRDILDREPEQPEPGRQLRSVPTLEGRVTLTGLGFSYPTSPDVPILRDITLDVLPGMTVAIVGRSGSGKSTLLKCLAGLLEPSEGSIAFDAVDLRELRWSELRRHVGLVPQRPYVFDDTLARNIAFGESDPDMAAVRAAAAIADVDSFAERLPLGYSTKLGEGGLRLSGGQSQRVAIARSIYHRPSVLLLDEATSALDSEGEQTVSANMRRLLEGHTAVVVAHRLSTIRDADLIVVLEEGRIAEMGNHDELFAADGLYFYLYGPQAAGG